MILAKRHRATDVDDAHSWGDNIKKAQRRTTITLFSVLPHSEGPQLLPPPRA